MCQWAAVVSLNHLSYHSSINKYSSHMDSLQEPITEQGWKNDIVMCSRFPGAPAAPSPSKTNVTLRSTRATTSRMMPMPKTASKSSTNMRSASTKAACTAKPPTTSTVSAQAAASPLPPLARWPPTNANTNAGTSAPRVSWASPPPFWHPRMSQRIQATMTWWTSQPSAARTPAWVPRRPPNSPPLCHTCWPHPLLLCPPPQLAQSSSLLMHWPLQVSGCPACCPRPCPVTCQWPSLCPTTPSFPSWHPGYLCNHLHKLLAWSQLHPLGPTPCPQTRSPKEPLQQERTEAWHPLQPPLPPPPSWRRSQRVKAWYHPWWPDWQLLPWSPPTTQIQVSPFTVSHLGMLIY